MPSGKNTVNTDVLGAWEAQSHGIYHVLPQQQNFAMGSLAQISSGAIRCSFSTRFRARFWRVLVRIYPVRFQKVPVKMLGEVLEGSSEDIS